MTSHGAPSTVESQLQKAEALLHAAVGTGIFFVIGVEFSHPWDERDSQD